MNPSIQVGTYLPYSSEIQCAFWNYVQLLTLSCSPYCAEASHWIRVGGSLSFDDQNLPVHQNLKKKCYCVNKKPLVLWISREKPWNCNLKLLKSRGIFFGVFVGLYSTKKNKHSTVLLFSSRPSMECDEMSDGFLVKSNRDLFFEHLLQHPSRMALNDLGWKMMSQWIHKRTYWKVENLSIWGLKMKT